MTWTRRRTILSAVATLTLGLLAFAGCDQAGQDGSTQHPALFAKPTTAPDQASSYPLDTCVVSGKKLGSKGPPTIIDYHGREVRFCCPNCEAKFMADPGKYLAKLDAAAKASPGQ